MHEEDVFVVYMHGFNSSPQSYKAQAVSAAMQKQGIGDRLFMPALPNVPDDAIQLLSAKVVELQQSYRVSLVGSSLGGFYATSLAERYQCTAVLVNPAVRPHELLRKYLGENINYHTSEAWQMDESHVEQLRLMDVENISHPERYLLMAQKGDETLDYREAEKKYKDCPSIIEEGGNHSFENFDQHINTLLNFCGFSLH